MTRFLAAMLWLAFACGAHAQQPAASPQPKIAISSLVGDTMNVTVYRQRSSSRLNNEVDVLKMPGPMFDLAVLKTTQEALGKVLPGADVAALRVPAAGSSADPALVYEDGKLVATNGLVTALKQQGFTHLITATRLRSINAVRLGETDVIGTGFLEGLGFYIDPNITTQRASTYDVANGIIAPHVYIELRLVDLNAMEIRAAQKITASSLVSAARNPAGTDAWGALTAAEKVEALDLLLRRNVGRAVPLLFPVNPVNPAK
jgi:hypothetical protein